MATLYNFDQQLEVSHQYADAPWWEVIYKQMWPDAVAFTCVRKDGLPQRHGVDRLITTSGGICHSVDEKVRTTSYPDILLEFLSDAERNIPGWVAKDLACDGVAYARVPTRDVFYLSTMTLHRAWRLYGSAWRKKHRIVTAYTRRGGSGQSYKTLSVAVPIPELLDALGDACHFTWSPTHDLHVAPIPAVAAARIEPQTYRTSSPPVKPEQGDLFARLPLVLKPPRDG